MEFLFVKTRPKLQTQVFVAVLVQHSFYDISFTQLQLIILILLFGVLFCSLKDKLYTDHSHKHTLNMTQTGLNP